MWGLYLNRTGELQKIHCWIKKCVRALRVTEHRGFWYACMQCSRFRDIAGFLRYFAISSQLYEQRVPEVQPHPYFSRNLGMFL